MGMSLFATSATIATDAVLVRAPPQQPRLMAGSNLKMYLPIHGASSMGTVVATNPQRNRPNPACLMPATNVGPAVRPTTAMNTFSPTLFMNHSVGAGMRPKVGRTPRSQPMMMPAISAPPDVDSVIGMPLIGTTMAPIRPPMSMPRPTNTMSVAFVGLSAYPRFLTASATAAPEP